MTIIFGARRRCFSVCHDWYGPTRRTCRRQLATATNVDLFDVAVVGGGPAGLSLLTALKSSTLTSHLRLALIETQDLGKVHQWRPDSDRYSNRASSLTPASRSYLQQIGAWSLMDQQRVKPYEFMRVWDGLSSRGRVDFGSPSNEEPIAYMTENQNLTRALSMKLQELSDVSVFDKTSVSRIDLGPPPDPSASVPNLSLYPHISLSSNQTIAARLLVGADGINGPVRKFAGIPTRGWDYDRHGTVATLKFAAGSENQRPSVAYQRFLPTGPIALLPLRGNHASVVWTTTPERAAILKTLPSEDFVAMINAAFRLEMVDIDFMSGQKSGQLSEYEWRSGIHPTDDLERRYAIPEKIVSLQEGSVASFPLRMRQANSYIAHRIALIGDAAHTIHPLAGQGLNMGLADSQSLTSAIQYAVQHGADLGDEMQCLNRYNSDTWMKNNRMLGIVDKLHWLYSARNPVVTSLRGFGLEVVDQLPGLKNWLMHQAGAASVTT